MLTTRGLTATAQLLSEAFLSDFPVKAARHFEQISASEAANVLMEHPVDVTKSIWKYMAPAIAFHILEKMTDKQISAQIEPMEVGVAIALLSQFEGAQQQKILGGLSPVIAKELSELLSFPEDAAGRMMDTRVMSLNENITIDEAIKQLKAAGHTTTDHLYLINDDHQLTGRVAGNRLALTPKSRKISSLALPIVFSVHTLDPKQEVIKNFESMKTDSIPVRDANENLVGVIKASAIYQDVKEDLLTDMQTMVGASKDERATSTSLFSVRKRLPWLQINLLTAFAASAVVGAFEDLISQFTALAILLPIAAGQSGNAGAQALAVTMRGLTLREITTRSWMKVLLKEVSTGFINGIAIAITCGLGVWVWSRSLGLSLVIALSMIASLTIAGAAGALVPIALKRLGLDPAQSSSIVLTTVTDIAGFLSFLGIATALSSLLPQA